MVEGVPEVRDTFGVAGCLQKAKDSGFDNQGCFQDYFLKGQQANEYFEYSNITESNPDSSQIHACMTFSGGAQHPDPAVASQFKACLEGYDNATKCDIPSIMWSGVFFLIVFVLFTANITARIIGRSANKIPVASYHTMVIDNMDKRKEFAENNIANIRGTVLTVLEQIANDFTGKEMSVSIFSSDGDVFHQCADCIMQVSAQTHLSHIIIHIRALLVLLLLVDDLVVADGEAEEAGSVFNGSAYVFDEETQCACQPHEQRERPHGAVPRADEGGADVLCEHFFLFKIPFLTNILFGFSRGPLDEQN